MTLWGYALLTAAGIFMAEMCVVTLGTLRIIFVSRGRTVLAPVLGFFEVTTWLFAITQVMQNLSQLECFMAFALGFAAGNFLGMLIERKLAMGEVLVRIITHHSDGELTRQLREANYGFTCVSGEGATGPVRIIMTVVKRRQLHDLLRLIESSHPKVFYAVDELQAASKGIFPLSKPRGKLPASLARWVGWESEMSSELVVSDIAPPPAAMPEPTKQAA
ncbi:MAG: DUF2179 domain-containing protein [Gemmataceae bacterium]|nr:DUF2179 domain-containing protein [Gemmataceae bacterium]